MKEYSDFLFCYYILVSQISSGLICWGARLRYGGTHERMVSGCQNIFSSSIKQFTNFTKWLILSSSCSNLDILIICYSFLPVVDQANIWRWIRDVRLSHTLKVSLRITSYNDRCFYKSWQLKSWNQSQLLLGRLSVFLTLNLNEFPPYMYFYFCLRWTPLLAFLATQNLIFSIKLNHLHLISTWSFKHCFTKLRNLKHLEIMSNVHCHKFDFSKFYAHRRR